MKPDGIFMPGLPQYALRQDRGKYNNRPRTNETARRGEVAGVSLASERRGLFGDLFTPRRRARRPARLLGACVVVERSICAARRTTRRGGGRIPAMPRPRQHL
jgi:hypothetical protein